MFGYFLEHNQQMVKYVKCFILHLDQEFLIYR